MPGGVAQITDEVACAEHQHSVADVHFGLVLDEDGSAGDEEECANGGCSAAEEELAVECSIDAEEYHGGGKECEGDSGKAYCGGVDAGDYPGAGHGAGADEASGGDGEHG